MQDLQASPITLTAIIDGPIEPAERIQVFDELRKFCNSSTKLVIRADARLFFDPTTHRRPVATAECVVVIEDGTVVVAGAVATTMRQAVDELIVRLRRRLQDSTSREYGLEARTAAAPDHEHA
jgi:ribosome-associated translation inhibitor RaiA